MIRQIISQHPREFLEDRGIFDQLVRAQHYGLPTRLLDVSLNPLVALYFAVCSNQGQRASVVVFKPTIGRQRYFDSHVVACMSSLALLTEGEKAAIREAARNYLLKADTTTRLVDASYLKAFNLTPEVEKLIQLVRQEHPDFKPILQPADLARPVSVVPRKLHSRIIAQNGAFVLFGLASKPNAANMAHIETEIIDIDGAAKPQFLRELGQVGISESSLFPEIEKAATAIKRRYE